MTEDMRERFEKWALDYFSRNCRVKLIGVQRIGEHYISTEVNRAWTVWQAAISSAGTSGTFDGNDALLVGSRGDQAREAFQAQLNHRGDSLSGKGEATLGTCNVLHPIGADDAHEKSDTCVDWKPVKGAPDRAEELARKILKMLISTEASRSKINIDRVASLLRREMWRSSGQEGRDGK